MPYQERLQKLKLPSLAFRRRRGDMIQVYKILHNLEAIPEGAFFNRAEGTTRGNSLKSGLITVKQRNRLMLEIITANMIHSSSHSFII